MKESGKSKKLLDEELRRLRDKFPKTGSQVLRDELFSAKGDTKTLIRGEKYDVIEKQFVFGPRVCLIKKKQEEYEDLQNARAFWWHYENSDHAINDWKKKLETDPGLDSRNLLRCNEIEEVMNRGIISIDGSLKFCELGFRSPEIMNYFKNSIGIDTKGYDISRYNVYLAQSMGYEAEYCDLGDIESELDLSGVQMCMCYQVLEHVSNPLEVMEKIYFAMDSGCYFHAEIPIEPGFPRIEWGHLYPFWPNDLEYMLQIAGFQLLTVSDKTWEGGPQIRRVMCQKPIDISGPETASTG